MLTIMGYSGLLAVDPGPQRSGYVLLDCDTLRPSDFGILENERLLDAMKSLRYDHFVVEVCQPHGMATPQEAMDAQFWAGRFCQASGSPFSMVVRTDVRLTICHSGRAKDANIRQAIIDRYGGKKQAVGTKRHPGPLYGLHGDCWQALAVGLTALAALSPTTRFVLEAPWE